MNASRIGPELRARITAVWPDILSAVADGGVIGEILKGHGFSRDHLRVYLSTEPEAKRQWDTARELSAESFFEQAQAIANSPGDDPKVARVRLQALMWMSAKRNPRLYSERAQLDVNVRTLDMTAIIQAANARLAAARPVAVIEGVATRCSA